ncbi:VOC family protein [Saccharothrix sp. S26]|uniref:VOC family protein n=1 Tax=Saccharothrix sp. S26 TaxID=2907215 RepID=UPI001F35FFD7|nr:VOC family protein [Saccharothrix sp. S26]MCE7000412.1 VOC family protein [Saccharothrix sp. S26]
MNRPDIAMKFNHIAIQTDDVDATITWYREFLGTTVEWELDTFSELTHARLPGIKRLVELRAGDVRLHVFDRTDHSLRGPGERDYQFQHVGILVDDPRELVRLREQWLRAREATDLKWLRDDPPSEIVTDADGMQSLYVLDPNGLEFEFLYLPGAAS